jgi:hypothetical protein
LFFSSFFAILSSSYSSEPGCPGFKDSQDFTCEKVCICVMRRIFCVKCRGAIYRVRHHSPHSAIIRHIPPSFATFRHHSPHSAIIRRIPPPQMPTTHVCGAAWALRGGRVDRMRCAHGAGVWMQTQGLDAINRTR